MQRLVEKLFKQYIEKVYNGQQLPPDQHEELRRCFYASVYVTLFEVSDVSSRLTEDQAIKVFETMMQECQLVAREVLEKYYKDQVIKTN